MKLSRTDAWLILLTLVVVSVAVVSAFSGIGAAGVLVVEALLIVSTSFKTVPEDERWTVEVLGAWNRDLEPGLHFLASPIEYIRMPQSTRQIVQDVLIEHTITASGIVIPRIEAKLRAQLNKDDEKAAKKLTYALAAPLPKALEALVDRTIRGIVGRHQFQYIWDNQKEIKGMISEALVGDLTAWGLEFINLDMTEIDPTEEIKALMQAPYKAGQEGEALVIQERNKGEAEKAKAEGSAAAIERLAQANKNAEIAGAEGEARARQLEAESKQAALKTLTAAFGNDIQKATDFMLAEEQYAAITQLGKGEGTIIVPAGTEGIAGLAGFIKGLATSKPTKKSV